MIKISLLLFSLVLLNGCRLHHDGIKGSDGVWYPTVCINGELYFAPVYWANPMPFYYDGKIQSCGDGY